MPLTHGAKLGQYEILAPLGAGGMGEVYRAKDTKLGREVAIKVLPAALAQDPDRLARFEREAKVLASLNHPNIAQIYGIEDRALVMELVPGECLKGPLPIATALNYARQIAEALEAAHEKGIVHRDLKPGNIMITPEGVVKVLDFGLAAIPQDTAPTSADPTLTMRATQAGMIMGTAAYMSPEQAAGKPVDRRSDIWSFGVVLHELLTGTRLFNGETISHTLADVLRGPIDLDKLPRNTPPAVRRLLERCLTRDLKKRLQAIGEARIALDESANAEPEPAPRNRSLGPWIVATASLLALAIGAVLFYQATRPPPPNPLMSLNVEISPDAPLERSDNRGPMVALSPDGSRLAVTLRAADGKIRLYTRLLKQTEVTLLAGTEGANEPFFSPDNLWIGFFADQKLKKISVEGGAAITLCDAATPRGASWGDDGNIIAALTTQGVLSRIPSSGGKPEPVTKLSGDEVTHRWPHVLPGSRNILFAANNAATVGSYGDATLNAISLPSGERKLLHHGGVSPFYVANPRSSSGFLVYLHQNTLFALPFDAARLAVTGAPAQILQGLSGDGRGGGDFGFSSAPSGTGTFVYLAGRFGNVSQVLYQVDRSGAMELLKAEGDSPRYSPDGKRMAFTQYTNQGFNVWVLDLDGGRLTRLSFAPDSASSPVWTPDGKHVVFSSLIRNLTPGSIYWTRSDGAGAAVRLTDGRLQMTARAISADGKQLALSMTGNAGSVDLYTVSFEGDPEHPTLGQPQLFVGTQFSEILPAFSPDGHWLAYASNETGVFEVYARPFPRSEGRSQISSGGGSNPVWSRNSHEILFSAPDGRVMTASYSVKSGQLIAEQPRPWSEARLRLPWFDLSPDGKHVAGAFFPTTPDGRKGPTHLTFLLNFTDELRRKLATAK